MSQSVFGDACWYRTLTLQERIASLRQAPASAAEDLSAAGDERTPRRIGPATKESPSTHAHRLAADGLTEAEFDRVLYESIGDLRARETAPSWVTEFLRPFEDASFVEPLPLTEQQRQHPMAGLLNPLRPLLADRVEALRGGIQALVRRRSILPFDPNTIVEILFGPLANQLLRVMSRTVALEVNVKRLEGTLRKDTPEERFLEFTEGLRQPDRAMELWQEYPVLARQAANYIHQWSTASLELLERLFVDWDTLRQAFSPTGSPGVLVRLTGESGDRHRDGRTVRVLEFSSGLRIVYKPKCMALAAHFQDFLQWINERSSRLTFRTVKVLDCGSHGWMEFVDFFPCRSAQEVERFFERQGGYLAVLYALDAARFPSGESRGRGRTPGFDRPGGCFHPRQTARSKGAACILT